jgi:hypothetical protein
MTPEDLAIQCRESEYVILALPPPLGRGYTRRLCGQRGPRGEILCGVEGSHQTVRFLSSAVLKFLKKVESEQ